MNTCTKSGKLQNLIPSCSLQTATKSRQQIINIFLPGFLRKQISKIIKSTFLPVLYQKSIQAIPFGVKSKSPKNNTQLLQ